MYKNTKKTTPISPLFTDDKSGKKSVKDMTGCLTILPNHTSKKTYKVMKWLYSNSITNRDQNLFIPIKMVNGKWVTENLNDVPIERLNNYGNKVDGELVFCHWKIRPSFNDDIILGELIVSHKSIGLGSHFMKSLCDKCDELGVPIIINEIRPFGKIEFNGRRLYKKDLFKFYKKLGFKIDYQDSKGFRKPINKQNRR